MEQTDSDAWFFNVVDRKLVFGTGRCAEIGWLVVSTRVVLLCAGKRGDEELFPEAVYS